MLLASCGGGGGGSSSEPTPPTSGQGDFTISTDKVNIESTVGDSPVYVQITGSLNNANSNVYLVVDTAGGSLIKDAEVQINGTSGTLILHPNNAAELPVGTNTGSITVKACKDASCTAQYSGSPKKINVTYKVNGISYEVSPTAVSLKMTAHHALPEPAVVNLSIGKEYVGYYGSTWAYTNNEDWLKVESNWNGNLGTAKFSIKKELSVGAYTANVDLFAFGKAFKRSVAVTYTVEPEPLTASLKNVSYKITNLSELSTLKSNLVIGSNLSTDLDWVVSTDASWIDISSSAGNTSNKTPIQFSVNASYQNLPKGFNKTTLVIQDKDKKSDPTIVNVELYIVDTGTPVTDAVANRFGIDFTDIAIDTLHGKFYLSESSTKRVYRADIASGLLEKYYAFEKTPEKMTLSRDSKTLYISVLEKDHDRYWFENQKGYISILDTEAEAVQKTLELNIDPYGIAVSSNGKLFVSGGSGQWTKLQVFDASTGANLGVMSTQIYELQNIYLDKAGKNLYLTDLNKLQKIDVSQVMPSVSKEVNSSFNPMNPFSIPTPDGKYLIMKGGELISASDLSIVKNLFPSPTVPMRVEDLWFDEANNRVIVFGKDLNASKLDVESYDLVNFQRTILRESGFISPQYGSLNKHSIWLYNGRLYYLFPDGEQYRLSSSAEM
jgi:hypothetical protein